MANKIFEVDIKGLRQLQEGKPKWFIIRELLQNAMDEDIKVCTINFYHERGKAHISVEDDSPIGFRDLADAYTLFKDTYKRSDVKKRGRFNFGEKQVLCMCDYAMITSTTGGLEFDLIKGEKKTLRRKTEAGSKVWVQVRMTREEYEECKRYAYEILRPLNITIRIVEHSNLRMEEEDGVITNTGYRHPHKVFTATLPTEVKVDDQMKTVRRETDVHIHKVTNGDMRVAAYIYEMGIPVCEIDCDYSIDVQQKVPLSSDRDKVDGKYLKDIFALVLNNTIDEISEENVSQTWIREALDSDKVEADTIQDVKDKRFGEKALIFNPNDPVANDEAISQGYRLIYGSEMSSNEWDKMKSHAGLVSSSKMFGSSSATDAVEIEWQPQHDRIAALVKGIAEHCLHINPSISFFKSRQATILAQYGGGQIAFNCSKIPKEWFTPDEQGYVRERMLDLIVHELAHSRGHHTEHSYHECITMMAARLVRKALSNVNFFRR
jgi:hypothetical protein